MSVIHALKAADVFLFNNNTPLFLQFGFRKWKASVTEKPIEDQSEIMKELHSDLSIVKAQERLGSVCLFFILQLCLTPARSYMQIRVSYTKELTCICDFCLFSGSVVTFGNVCYVFLFGWWIALIYILISAVMFLTVAGAAYGM